MNTNCLIDKDNIDINSLFKIEEETTNDIYLLENKIKDLDYIYLNYSSFKKRIKKRIKNKKKILIEINTKKDLYNKYDIKDKLNILSLEYNLLLNTTNNNYLKNKINNLIKRINSIKNNNMNNKLTIKYNKLLEKHKKIISILDSENDISTIPNNLDDNSSVIWYEEMIDKLTIKKMIIDNYLYCLEDLYKDIIEKRC